MKIYYLTILGYYGNTTRQTSVKCDGMSYSHEGFYKFWVKIEGGRYEDVAFYPIRNTIITNIENVKD